MTKLFLVRFTPTQQRMKIMTAVLLPGNDGLTVEVPEAPDGLSWKIEFNQKEVAVSVLLVDAAGETVDSDLVDGPMSPVVTNYDVQLTAAYILDRRLIQQAQGLI